MLYSLFLSPIRLLSHTENLALLSSHKIGILYKLFSFNGSLRLENVWVVFNYN